MELNIEKLKALHGNIIQSTLPSGFKVIIREQNGEDDDVLSNAKDVNNGISFNRFIQRIVVWTDFTENNKLHLDDIGNMKLCDKYAILIISRIFSIGQTIKFQYDWDDKLTVDYEEDLGLFIWEYHDKEKPFPIKGDELYNPSRIKPHPAGKELSRDITLSSGKHLRYKYINGNGEKWLMELDEENQSINAELKARNLELEMPNGWMKVENFKTFSTMDMRELRFDVNNNDPVISLLSTIENPKNNTIVNYPIVASTDFFYPREI